MGGVRTLKRSVGTRPAVVLAMAVVLAGACGRGSEGQEAGRRDRALERKVEALLPELERLSHLPARQAPGVRRASAATLERYLLERLDAEYPGDTLERIALAYRTFGLLPDTVDLRGLLVDLLLEQTVGYYDPARDVLFIREEASQEMLDAVVVHELVHALQDQVADLDSLLKQAGGNDARTAAQAAMEGHAMVAMLAQQAAALTGGSVSVTDLPELSPDMAGLLVSSSAYPQLATAPAIVREPLLFLYLGGARYVQRLWRGRSDEPVPFGEWLPESTEQLLHTQAILGERDRPTPLAVAGPPASWTTRYASDLGELELRIYFEEHLQDEREAERAAAGWDGDAYALLSDGEALVLVWYTAWDSEADAQEFGDAYRRVFGRRFGEAGGSAAQLVGGGRWARVESLTLAGVPVVRVVEGPEGTELPIVPEARLAEPGW